MTPTDPQHEDVWSGNAWSWTEATPVSVPATLDFSARPADTVSGIVEEYGEPVAGAPVSAYPSSNPDATPKSAMTDANGAYSIKLATTAYSGQTYKIRTITQGGTTRWYGRASGNPGDATEVQAALTAEMLYYIFEQQFTTDTVTLGQIDSNIAWVLGDPAPGTSEVRVGVADNVSSNDSVCLSARTWDGRYWGIANIAAGDGAGTWYFPNTVTNPLANCTAAMIKTGLRGGWGQTTPPPQFDTFAEADPVDSPETVNPDIDPPAAKINAYMALNAENSAYAGTAQYSTDTATLSTIEPTITWTLGAPSPGTDEVRVGVATNVSPNDSTCVTGRSSTGVYWAIGSVRNGAETGVYYFKSPASDPLSVCTVAAIIAGNPGDFPLT